MLTFLLTALHFLHCCVNSLSKVWVKEERLHFHHVISCCHHFPISYLQNMKRREAREKKREQKEARRQIEADRRWVMEILSRQNINFCLSLCVIIPNSKVSNRSYNPFSQLESSVLYLQHDLFWIPIVMFKNNFCPIRTDNRHIIFMSSSDFQYQSCVETYC